MTTVFSHLAIVITISPGPRENINELQSTQDHYIEMRVEKRVADGDGVYEEGC